MKKLLILLPFIAFFLVLCSEAPELPGPTSRTVLTEFFTEDGWAFCALAEQALDSLVKIYGDSLAVISYNHTQGNVAVIGPRWEFYNRPIYPTAVFDGTDEVFEQNPNAYFTTYDEHIIAAKADTPSYNLELTATATANAGNLGLKIVTADTIPEGPMIAYVVICQDSIPGMLGLFSYVCQQLYTFPVTLVYPDSLDTNIVFNHNIPVENMTAVVFVQDTTSKKVMHAVTKQFEEE